MGIEEKLPSGILLTTVEKVAGYARKSSVWPATFGLACCAMELISTGGPRHDLARFGMERASNTPRQADLMIVAGRVSQKMAPVLRQIYDQMSDPKWVISMGVCASSGGMFNNYAIVQGVDHIVPVDIYLPGCPPRPEMLLDAIVKLHDKIQNMKLGVNREPEVEELEQARLRRLPLAADLGQPAACTGPPWARHAGQRPPLARPSEPGRGSTAGRDRGAGRRASDRGDRPTRPERRPARRSRIRPRRPARNGWASRSCGPACSAPSHRGHLGLRRAAGPAPGCRPRPRPYGSYFDEIADGLAEGLAEAAPAFADAVERVIVDRGELTLHVPREHLVEVARLLRDEPTLGFELCRGVSGVHYPGDTGRELHAVYQLLSITHNRRVRLEVSVPDADPHIPVAGRACTRPATGTSGRPGTSSVSSSTGHPALTRIEMPDDWKGHPQRKDYPLGGIPVEYRGATVPPPDERRAYSDHPG